MKHSSFSVSEDDVPLLQRRRGKEQAKRTQKKADDKTKTGRNAKKLPQNKKFVIPRKKKARELFETQKLDTRDAKDLLRTVSQSFYQASLSSAYSYQKVTIVHNARFNEEFIAKKQEMRLGGYTQKELEDCYAYIYFDRWDKVKKISKEGLRIDSCFSSALGDPKMGVYLSRFPDLVSSYPLFCQTSMYLMVFKIAKGKLKAVGERTGDASALEPTPNYDGHISKSFPPGHKVSMAQAYVSSQYYFYEFMYDGDDIHRRRPRQCCPYAVIQFVITSTSLQYRELSTWSVATNNNNNDLESTKSATIITDGRMYSDYARHGRAIWSGIVKNKENVLSTADLICFSNDELPFPIGEYIDVKAKVAHEKLQPLLPSPIFTHLPVLSGKCKAFDNRTMYLCCEIRSQDKSNTKLAKLLSYFKGRNLAGVAEFPESDAHIYVIPTCDFTHRLGLTDQYYPDVLHVLLMKKLPKEDILSYNKRMSKTSPDPVAEAAVIRDIRKELQQIQFQQIKTHADDDTAANVKMDTSSYDKENSKDTENSSSKDSPHTSPESRTKDSTKIVTSVVKDQEVFKSPPRVQSHPAVFETSLVNRLSPGTQSNLVTRHFLDPRLGFRFSADNSCSPTEVEVASSDSSTKTSPSFSSKALSRLDGKVIVVPEASEPTTSHTMTTATDVSSPERLVPKPSRLSSRLTALFAQSVKRSPVTTTTGTLTVSAVTSPSTSVCTVSPTVPVTVTTVSTTLTASNSSSTCATQRLPVTVTSTAPSTAILTTPFATPTSPAPRVASANDTLKVSPSNIPGMSLKSNAKSPVASTSATTVLNKVSPKSLVASTSATTVLNKVSPSNIPGMSLKSNAKSPVASTLATTVLNKVSSSNIPGMSLKSNAKSLVASTSATTVLNKVSPSTILGMSLKSNAKSPVASTLATTVLNKVSSSNIPGMSLKSNAKSLVASTSATTVLNKVSSSNIPGMSLKSNAKSPVASTSATTVSRTKPVTQQLSDSLASFVLAALSSPPPPPPPPPPPATPPPRSLLSVNSLLPVKVSSNVALNVMSPNHGRQTAPSPSSVSNIACLRTTKPSDNATVWTATAISSAPVMPYSATSTVSSYNVTQPCSVASAVSAMQSESRSYFQNTGTGASSSPLRHMLVQYPPIASLCKRPNNTSLCETISATKSSSPSVASSKRLASVGTAATTPVVTTTGSLVQASPVSPLNVHVSPTTKDRRETVLESYSNNSLSTVSSVNYSPAIVATNAPLPFSTEKLQGIQWTQLTAIVNKTRSLSRAGASSEKEESPAVSSSPSLVQAKYPSDKLELSQKSIAIPTMGLMSHGTSPEIKWMNSFALSPPSKLLEKAKQTQEPFVSTAESCNVTVSPTPLSDKIIGTPSGITSTLHLQARESIPSSESVALGKNGGTLSEKHRLSHATCVSFESALDAVLPPVLTEVGNKDPLFKSNTALEQLTNVQLPSQATSVLSATPPETVSLRTTATRTNADMLIEGSKDTLSELFTVVKRLKCEPFPSHVSTVSITSPSHPNSSGVPVAVSSQSSHRLQPSPVTTRATLTTVSPLTPGKTLSITGQDAQTLTSKQSVRKPLTVSAMCNTRLEGGKDMSKSYSPVEMSLDISPRRETISVSTTAELPSISISETKGEDMSICSKSDNSVFSKAENSSLEAFPIPTLTVSNRLPHRKSPRLQVTTNESATLPSTELQSGYAFPTGPSWFRFPPDASLISARSTSSESITPQTAETPLTLSPAVPSCLPSVNSTPHVMSQYAMSSPSNHSLLRSPKTAQSFSEHASTVDESSKETQKTNLGEIPSDMKMTSGFGYTKRYPDVFLNVPVVKPASPEITTTNTAPTESPEIKVIPEITTAGSELEHGTAPVSKASLDQDTSQDKSSNWMGKQPSGSANESGGSSRHGKKYGYEKKVSEIMVESENEDSEEAVGFPTSQTYEMSTPEHEGLCSPISSLEFSDRDSRRACSIDSDGISLSGLSTVSEYRNSDEALELSSISSEESDLNYEDNAKSRGLASDADLSREGYSSCERGAARTKRNNSRSDAHSDSHKSKVTSTTERGRGKPRSSRTENSRSRPSNKSDSFRDRTRREKESADRKDRRRRSSSRHREEGRRSSTRRSITRSERQTSDRRSTKYSSSLRCRSPSGKRSTELRSRDRTRDKSRDNESRTHRRHRSRSSSIRRRSSRNIRSRSNSSSSSSNNNNTRWTRRRSKTSKARGEFKIDLSDESVLLEITKPEVIERLQEIVQAKLNRTLEEAPSGSNNHDSVKSRPFFGGISEFIYGQRSEPETIVLQDPNCRSVILDSARKRPAVEVDGEGRCCIPSYYLVKTDVKWSSEFENIFRSCGSDSDNVVSKCRSACTEYDVINGIFKKDFDEIKNDQHLGVSECPASEGVCRNNTASTAQAPWEHNVCDKAEYLFSLPYIAAFKEKRRRRLVQKQRKMRVREKVRLSKVTIARLKKLEVDVRTLSTRTNKKEKLQDEGGFKVDSCDREITGEVTLLGNRETPCKKPSGSFVIRKDQGNRGSVSDLNAVSMEISDSDCAICERKFDRSSKGAQSGNINGQVCNGMHGCIGPPSRGSILGQDLSVNQQKATLVHKQISPMVATRLQRTQPRYPRGTDSFHSSPGPELRNKSNYNAPRNIKLEDDVPSRQFLTSRGSKTNLEENNHHLEARNIDTECPVEYKLDCVNGYCVKTCNVSHDTECNIAGLEKQNSKGYCFIKKTNEHNGSRNNMKTSEQKRLSVSPHGHSTNREQSIKNIRGKENAVVDGKLEDKRRMKNKRRRAKQHMKRSLYRGRIFEGSDSRNLTERLAEQGSKKNKTKRNSCNSNKQLPKKRTKRRPMCDLQRNEIQETCFECFGEKTDAAEHTTFFSRNDKSCQTEFDDIAKESMNHFQLQVKIIARKIMRKLFPGESSNQSFPTQHILSFPDLEKGPAEPDVVNSPDKVHEVEEYTCSDQAQHDIDVDEGQLAEQETAPPCKRQCLQKLPEVNLADLSETDPPPPSRQAPTVPCETDTSVDDKKLATQLSLVLGSLTKSQLDILFAGSPSRANNSFSDSSFRPFTKHGVPPST